VYHWPSTRRLFFGKDLNWETGKDKGQSSKERDQRVKTNLQENNTKETYSTINLVRLPVLGKTDAKRKNTI
jgi:hypothetical protein